MSFERAAISLVEKTIITGVIKIIGIRAKHPLTAPFGQGDTVGEAIDGQQIVFTVPVDLIAGLLQITQQVRLVGPEHMPEGAMAAHVGVPTGH